DELLDAVVRREGARVLNRIRAEVTGWIQGRRGRVDNMDLERGSACVASPVRRRAGHGRGAEGKGGVSCRCAGDQPRLSEVDRRWRDEVDYRAGKAVR